MKTSFFFCVLQLLTFSLLAQFTDNFSGGSLATYWQGDIDKFTVTNGELQLNDELATSSNTSTLYAIVPTNTTATTSWELYVRCDFSPSTGNFTTIYLTVNQPPVAGTTLHGYYLKIGGITGGNDALELYRQDGATDTLLISGDIGAVANEPVNVRILVERTPAGEWSLEADYTGGEDYDSQGTATDATYSSGLYFGMSCKYTITRNMSFFFDDIRIEPIVVDEIAPQALSVSAESNTRIVVQFDEPLADSSIEEPADFSINNGIGAATTAGFVNGDRTKVQLELATPLVNLTTYTLSLSNLEDLAGNVTLAQELTFDFLLPEAPAVGDLIFTEIFPDPTPPVGLPDFEYIELLNTSGKVLQLGGLALSTGSTPQTINPLVILPGAYVIVCDEDAAASFAGFGEVATIPAFPALTNGGDDLILTDANGLELINLTYSASWYQDDLRGAGGYALELIDPDLPNSCPGNWRASLSNTGGTPGQENSLAGVALETDPPLLRTAFAPNNTQIILRFNDELDGGMELVDFFSISPALTIGDVSLEPDRQSVRLFLSEPLVENTVYQVSSLPGLMDCLGNTTVANQTISTGLTEGAVPGDLIINELLFNPYTGGVDFLELHNPGPKLLNLQGLRLRNELAITGTIGTTVEVDYVLLPGDYVVITSNPDNILDNYTVPKPAALLAGSLPSMPDDEGNITVYNAAFELLDALDYTEDWHSRLLSDRDGVSLERLRAEATTQNEGNWASAASTVGFATPTGRNSQDRQTVVEPQDDFFVLPEQTFSPDEDGFQDVLEIQYSTDKAGYLSRLLIFDAQGRLVRRLDDLELLAGQGSFLWDGSTDDENKARIGIYIIVAEIFTPEGDTLTEKHTCVLAGRLD
jgi:hypothetical protein